MDALNLEKGDVLNLSKSFGVSKIRIGLGWELLKDPLDLDVSVIMLNNLSGKPLCETAKHIVFYGNKVIPGITHHGDNLTGDGDGDDEIIDINFTEVMKNYPKVDEISVFVSVYNAKSTGKNFGNLKEAFIHIYNDAGENLVNYDLDADFPDKIIVQVGSFKRKDNEWSFEAIGIGANRDLNDVAKAYGL